MSVANETNTEVVTVKEEAPKKRKMSVSKVIFIVACVVLVLAIAAWKASAGL